MLTGSFALGIILTMGALCLALALIESKASAERRRDADRRRAIVEAMNGQSTPVSEYRCTNGMTVAEFIADIRASIAESDSKEGLSCGVTS